MAEIRFAAGAQLVLPAHEQSRQYYRSWDEARKAIAAFDMKPYLTGAGSAMSWAGVGWGHEKKGVIRPDGQHGNWPTCQCMTARSSPPALAPTRNCRSAAGNRLAAQLAKRLTGKDVRLA